MTNASTVLGMTSPQDKSNQGLRIKKPKTGRGENEAGPRKLSGCQRKCRREGESFISKGFRCFFVEAEGGGGERGEKKR